MPAPHRLLATATLLLACASAQCAPELHDYAGRKVEVLKIVAPASHATVVFENGSRETLDKWDKVIPAIARDATVFAYNRPGYGKSDQPATPRTGAAIVEELRAMLKQEGLQPPYVLVGHSLGGLYMQLYARSYPQEVRGVVLVDAVYPGIIKRPQDFPFLTRVAKYVLLNKTVEGEIDEIHNTGQAVLAQPWNDAIPMVRLINVPKSAGAVAVDFGVVNSDDKTMQQVKAMYPRARTQIVDSDHQIQVATPEVVVSAIREVMDTAPARPVAKAD